MGFVCLGLFVCLNMLLAGKTPSQISSLPPKFKSYCKRNYNENGQNNFLHSFRCIKKSSVKVNVEVDSKHDELVFFSVRSFPKCWDKPKLVIFLSIMMSGEWKTNMDIDTLKM